MPSHPSENIPLALSTNWFLTQPPTFPYPELRAHAPISSATYTWECTECFDTHLSSPASRPSQDWTLIGAVQWEIDMSISKLRIRWNTADIPGTLRADIKHIPSIAATSHSPLTPDQLRLASQWYAPHILSFARSHLYTTVADGECWSLASAALHHARHAAVRDGHEPPRPSTGRVHGHLILDWSVSSHFPPDGILKAADVRAGDIMELSDAHFRHRRALLGGLVTGEENVRVGEHTAIVEWVRGVEMGVLEQNARVERVVMEGKYDLGEMMKGRVMVYRPVGGASTGVLSLEGVCEQW
ncbi:predicted protein [Uncinocarpus reesii 1704]|uniref:BBC1/AIM3 cysteine proteinase-fold domain-containing protein n=1 Tax=Uncinocarpus reesii (strain UAMH 1704) TaxID=336963 RepID=C4JIR4_UNCRE|nr:uncharacterized protein UREG_02925 [Uncinocarpus reesii 1704]EEP78076.1 predicted protein [Uncinocarpus reesii 1704]